MRDDQKFIVEYAFKPGFSIQYIEMWQLQWMNQANKTLYVNIPKELFDAQNYAIRLLTVSSLLVRLKVFTGPSGHSLFWEMKLLLAIMDPIPWAYNRNNSSFREGWFLY